MKALLTGANGTVGRALAATLESRGYDVVAWDRAQVPVDDAIAGRAFLESQRPDLLFHLAVPSQSTGMADEGTVVTCDWSEHLARDAHELGIRFVFTSTVMVFSNDAVGPFTVESPPDAAEGYGYEKRVAEARVLTTNPSAIVARLGWQIGEAPGSNNMIDFFTRQQCEQGVVRASCKWLPACSFLPDTADALVSLVDMPGGLYQINGNAHWNFHQIAMALNELHGDPWRIEASEDFVYDQRMIDERVLVKPIEQRLPALI